MLWPLESGAWTLPKNSSLELMSSVYSTLTPNSSSKASSDGRSLVSSSMSMYSVQFEMRSVSASSPVDAAVVSAGALVATSAALLEPASLVAPPALDAALDSGAAGAAALVASPSSSPSMPPPPHAASSPGTASSDPPAAMRCRNCLRLVDRIVGSPSRCGRRRTSRPCPRPA